MRKLEQDSEPDWRLSSGDCTMETGQWRLDTGQALDLKSNTEQDWLLCQPSTSCLQLFAAGPTGSRAMGINEKLSCQVLLMSRILGDMGPRTFVGLEKKRS